MTISISITAVRSPSDVTSGRCAARDLPSYALERVVRDIVRPARAARVAHVCRPVVGNRGQDCGHLFFGVGVDRIVARGGMHDVCAPAHR
jgi:hypothetical protein